MHEPLQLSQSPRLASAQRAPLAEVKPRLIYHRSRLGPYRSVPRPKPIDSLHFAICICFYGTFSREARRGHLQKNHALHKTHGTTENKPPTRAVCDATTRRIVFEDRQCGRNFRGGRCANEALISSIRTDWRLNSFTGPHRRCPCRG